MSNKLGIGETPHGTALERLVRSLRGDGLRDGALLPTEKSLSEGTGIGRQKVREGLAVLEAFGAADSRQGARRVWRGYQQKKQAETAFLFLDDPVRMLADLVVVRQALETSLLPSTIGSLNPSTLRELRSLSEEINNLAAAGKPFFEADEQFHKALFRPLKNSALEGILDTFWTFLDGAREQSPDEDVATENVEIAAMHGRIVDAIEKGDAALAVHHLDTHFYGVRNRYPLDGGGASVLMAAS